MITVFFRKFYRFSVVQPKTTEVNRDLSKKDKPGKRKNTPLGKATKTCVNRQNTAIGVWGLHCMLYLDHVPPPEGRERKSLSGVSRVSTLVCCELSRSKQVGGS
jgi:hypothetical protein